MQLTEPKPLFMIAGVEWTKGKVSVNNDTSGMQQRERNQLTHAPPATQHISNSQTDELDRTGS